MRFIILAGGLGTRINSVVSNVPKVMAPVAGKPFLQYIFDNIIRSGFTEATLSVGYKSDDIINYFGDKYETLQLEYEVEENPLGTGGAIESIMSTLDNEDVIILNGDTYLNINFKNLYEWFIGAKLQFSMVIKNVNDTSRFGSVHLDMDNNIIGFGEKNKIGPGFINAGVYILNSSIYDSVKNKYKFPYSFEKKILVDLVKSLIFKGYITDSYFVDIGVPADYYKAIIDFQNIHDS